MSSAEEVAALTYLPGEWSKLAHGQPIKVTVGESVIVGDFLHLYDKADGAQVDIVPDGSTDSVVFKIEAGWTLFVGSALPTVPGLYLDCDGDVWRLSKAGNWVPGFDPGNLSGGNPYQHLGGAKLAVLDDLRSKLASRMPLRRLEVRDLTVAATLRLVGENATADIPGQADVISHLERADALAAFSF